MITLLLLLLYPAPRDPEPDPLARGFVGVQLTKRVGVVVTRVVPNSPADRGGLHEDDEIVTINDTPFDTVQDMAEYIRHCRPGNTMVLKLKRAGKALTVRVKVGARPTELP